MAFTAEEQAVLSQVAYYDISLKEDRPESLEVVLREVENQANANGNSLKDALGEDMYAVYLGLLEKIEGQDYQVISSVNDNADTGFVAFAIEHPNEDVTVVCCGTEDMAEIFVPDVLTDVQIGTRKETNQQQELEKMLDDLEKQGYDSFYFTGHSLGGNLAIHGALSRGDPDKVKGVSTFNAPGFNDRYWSYHRMRAKEMEDCIVNYENEYDYVSSIFTKPGERVVVDSVGKGTDFGFSHHSICNLKLNGGSFETTSSKGWRAALPLVLTDGVLDLGWDLNILLSYVGAGLTNGPMTGYRDFSKAALDTMVAAAKETEEEDWWDVTRWDCWYRLDRLFGAPVMNLQYLTGDVDAYYRKLIDVNGASVADVEAIFEKVYSVDEQYAATIRKCSSNLGSQVKSKLREIAGGINANANSADGSSTHTSSSGAQHGGGGGRFGQAGGSSTHTSSSGAQHGGGGGRFGQAGGSSTHTSSSGAQHGGGGGRFGQAGGSSTHTSSSGSQHGGGGGGFGQAGGSSTHTSSSGSQHGGSGRKF